MTTGLIIGKFMPIHKGHMALINFANSRCDRLIICVCTLDGEPIEGQLRYKWVKEIYKDFKNIEVKHITERLHGKNLDIEKATKLWAKYLIKSIDPIDIIFSSEEYGNYLAKYINAKHIQFDPNRKNNKISATMIRNNPLKYRNFIPDIVKPYFKL